MTLQTTWRRRAADVSPEWEAFDNDYELQEALDEAEGEKGRKRKRHRPAPGQGQQGHRRQQAQSPRQRRQQVPGAAQRQSRARPVRQGTGQRQRPQRGKGKDQSRAKPPAIYRPTPGGQRTTTRHIRSVLRDQGVLTTPHSVYRMEEPDRREGAKLDPKNFVQDFMNGQHYKDTRKGYTSNYVVIGGKTFAYTWGGPRGEQIVLKTMLEELPQQAVQIDRPRKQPRPMGEREAEALYEWEEFDRDYELQNILREAESWREGESFAALLSRARADARLQREAERSRAHIYN